MTDWDLAPYLDHLGVDYDPGRGRQVIKCPWHDESRPSCSLDLDQGLVNCFSCGVSGDLVSLIQHEEGCDIAVAFKRAEEIAGETGREVSRKPDRGSGLLPRKQGSRPGRRKFRSPWARNRP